MTNVQHTYKKTTFHEHAVLGTKGFGAVLDRHLVRLRCKACSFATMLQAQPKLVLIHSAGSCTIHYPGTLKF